MEVLNYGLDCESAVGLLREENWCVETAAERYFRSDVNRGNRIRENNNTRRTNLRPASNNSTKCNKFINTRGGGSMRKERRTEKGVKEEGKSSDGGGRKRYEDFFHDYSFGCEKISINGIIALCEDLYIPPTHPFLLSFACKCQCKKQGEICKEEWEKGINLLGVKDIIGLSEKMDFINQELLSLPSLKPTYIFAFSFCLDRGRKHIEIDLAVGYWVMLLTPHFVLIDDWVSFIQNKYQEKIKLNIQSNKTTSNPITYNQQNTSHPFSSSSSSSSQPSYSSSSSSSSQPSLSSSSSCIKDGVDLISRDLWMMFYDFIVDVNAFVLKETGICVAEHISNNKNNITEDGTNFASSASSIPSSTSSSSAFTSSQKYLSEIYDFSGAWPWLIDEFVEIYRCRQKEAGDG